MPYDIKRLIISVSLCAMLAVNPVLATAPGENESVGGAHTVYDGTKLGKVTKGIAGVGYVNSMVDAAGNAAQAAEAHAAAAGASALSAAESADEAHAVLKDKVDIAQGAYNGNKVMVTDGGGDVIPGQILSGMISTGAVKAENLFTEGASLSSTGILIGHPSTRSDSYGNPITGAAVMQWLQPEGAGVLVAQSSASGVTSLKWLTTSGTAGVLHAVHTSGGGIGLAFDKLPLNHITTDVSGLLIAKNSGVSIYSSGFSNAVLTQLSDGTIAWQKVGTQNTDGVVGMVPVGSAGATTYGQFWIE